MKVTDANVHKQEDGNYRIGPAHGITFVNTVNGIKCKRAVDQTEAQVKDWSEE